MTEDEEYQRIVDSRPPDRADFIERRTHTRYSSDGLVYTTCTSTVHAGVPVLVTLEEDLHDSYWVYPPKSMRQVAGANKTPVTHAQYMKARRR